MTRLRLAAAVAVLTLLAPSVPVTAQSVPVQERQDVHAAGASRCPTPLTDTAPRGWRRTVTSAFSETTPLGSWPGPVAAAFWKNRAAGARDSSGRGVYDSGRTVSEAGGLLDVWIHSESGGNRVHDPEGQRYVAAIVSRFTPLRGARVTLCLRADVIPGYKLVDMLWPTSGTGNQLGEIDFPEGRLTGSPATARAFMHYAPKPSSGRQQDAFDTGVTLQGWHAYTIEWNPMDDDPYVNFFRDGILVGRSRSHVPTTTMNLILQHETFVAGQTLPAPAEGHVQIDWITVDVPHATFADTIDSPFLANIEWLAAAGISGGCSATWFCPASSVTRGQMAAFLSRAFGLAATSTDHFADDDTSLFESNINRVAESKISGGCGTRRFCPSAFVSRAQMASFLARALRLPPATRDHFSDDESSMHEDAINRLADRGIAAGCAESRFCPTARVTREQMAAFLFRALH